MSPRPLFIIGGVYLRSASESTCFLLAPPNRFGYYVSVALQTGDPIDFAVMAKKLSPAQLLGRRGGKARNAKLTSEERRELSLKLNASRWAQWYKKTEEEREAIRRKRARKRRKK